MKLLRDFFRLRTAGRFSLADRRAGSRRTFTVTVPAPLSPPTQAPQPAVIDMHWKADAKCGLLVARWHEHVPPQVPRHLSLVPSL
jgi:hypothetical protein